MKKTLKSAIIVFLTLTLTISNLGHITQLFANEDKVDESLTDFKPDKVEGMKVTDKSGTCIKIEWNSAQYAAGYRIYRSTVKSGIYRKINEVNEKTTCYVDQNLECGTNYYYRVRAFNKIGQKTCMGCPSDPLDATTCPAKVKNLCAKCVSDCSIELSWQTLYKSSGYEVYRATCENGNYERIATLTDNGKSSYRDKNLKSNKKYYYKVRAFKEVDGQISFGKCCDVLAVCTEK